MAGPDDFPNLRATYNTLVDLELGNIPKGNIDNSVYKELLRIHDAIERLAGNFMQLNDGDLLQHKHWLKNLQDVEITEPVVEDHGIFWDIDLEKWVNTAVPYQYAEAWPTGLADGGELNIGPGVNDVEIIAGIGVTVDTYTEPTEQTQYLGLKWPQINTAITAAPVVAGSIVWISIQDTGVPADPNGDLLKTPINVGAIYQSATRPTPIENRQRIFLGVLIHNGTEWKEVSNPKVINQAAETLREIATTVLPLTTIIEGGQVTETGTFSLNQAEGVVWEQNRNWHVSKADPNREVLPAAAPVSFNYINADFSNVGSSTSTFDPTMYTPYPGTAAPISVPGPANTCTIQKLYLDPANNYWVLWGQYVYVDFAIAEANIRTDLAKSNIPFLLNNSILLGFAVMQKNKSNWDSEEAVFIPVNWKV